MQTAEPVLSSLAQRIQQKVAFPSLPDEAFLLVQYVASRQLHQLERLYKRFGLTAAQYNALRILRGAGDNGLPCGEVGQRMVHTDSDITRLLDRLEKKDWIKRARSQEDRRVIVARISEKGIAALSDLDALVTIEISGLWAGLPRDSVTQLVQVLNQWVASSDSLTP